MATTPKSSAAAASSSSGSGSAPAKRKTSHEFDPNETAREAPPGLEHKSTADTPLIGYNPSPVPVGSRTGSSLTDDERANSLKHPGTPAAGNGVQNSGVGSGGVTTGSGGTTSGGTSGTGGSSSGGSGGGS